MTVGERLNLWMKNNNLIQKKLESLAGIPQGLISDYKNDKKEIGSSNLIKLYKTTNIDIVWLLTGEVNRKQINEEDICLIENFNKLNKEDREEIQILLNTKLKKYKNMNNYNNDTKSLTSIVG